LHALHHYLPPFDYSKVITHELLYRLITAFIQPAITSGVIGKKRGCFEPTSKA
jgi:hypothetical protein